MKVNRAKIYFTMEFLKQLY